MDFKETLNELLKELKNIAEEHYGDKLISIVVFGSVAKGKATPESDIDLLVVLEDKPKSSYETYMDYYDNVESKLKTLKELNMRISPIFIRKASLREDLPWLWDTEFIILYNRDGFFQNFIRRLEEFKKKKLRFVKKPMSHYIVKQ